MIQVTLTMVVHQSPTKFSGVINHIWYSLKFTPKMSVIQSTGLNILADSAKYGPKKSGCLSCSVHAVNQQLNLCHQGASATHFATVGRHSILHFSSISVVHEQVDIFRICRNKYYLVISLINAAVAKLQCYLGLRLTFLICETLLFDMLILN